MRKIYLLFAFVFGVVFMSNSQIGIGTSTVDPSAVLEIESTEKGILIPRMTEAEKSAILNPATGLLVYQTDAVDGFYFFNGSGWNPIADVQPAIEKTSNDGYRFVGSGRSVGANAIDFSLVESVPSGTYGARNSNAVAIGNGVLASGTNSVAIGYLNRSSNNNSVTLGSNNLTSGTNALGLGDNNNVTGQYNIGVGSNNATAGNYSIAIGSNNLSSGTTAVAIGNDNRSGSIDSISIGDNNENLGTASVMVGRENYNIGENTYMLGEGLSNAGGLTNITMVGFYNASTGAFVVGNGTSSTNRSDALLVSGTGLITAPDLDISEITDTKALITKEYADNNYVRSSSPVSYTVVNTFGTSYSAYNNGWQIPRFYIQDDRVYLEGLARRVNSGFVSSETIFTLPVGYRPLANRTFTAGQSGNQLRVDVYPDGRVVYINGTDGFNDYVSLDNISFRID